MLVILKKQTKDLPTKQFLNKLNTYQLYFINVSVQGSTSPLCTFVLRVEWLLIMKREFYFRYDTACSWGEGFELIYIYDGTMRSVSVQLSTTVAKAWEHKNWKSRRKTQIKSPLLLVA